MHLNGFDIESLIKKFGDGIVNIHFRDSDGVLVDEHGRRKYLLPGKGEIDLQTIVRVLNKFNYDKALTVEVSHRSL